MNRLRTLREKCINHQISESIFGVLFLKSHNSKNRVPQRKMELPFQVLDGIPFPEVAPQPTQCMVQLLRLEARQTFQPDQRKLNHQEQMRNP